jgi:hypothetical protein
MLNPSLSSTSIYSENVPGLPLTLSAKNKNAGNVPLLAKSAPIFPKISRIVAELKYE